MSYLPFKEWLNLLSRLFSNGIHFFLQTQISVCFLIHSSIVEHQCWRQNFAIANSVWSQTVICKSLCNMWSCGSFQYMHGSGPAGSHGRSVFIGSMRFILISMASGQVYIPTSSREEFPLSTSSPPFVVCFPNDCRSYQVLVPLICINRIV